MLSTINLGRDLDVCHARLVHSVVACKKFADEYAIQNLQLFSIGVKLAIPVSFILYICLNDFLFGFFRLTLVY